MTNVPASLGVERTGEEIGMDEVGGDKIPDVADLVVG